MRFGHKSHSLPPTRGRTLLRWSGYFFSAIGIVTLGYCGFVLLDAWLFQSYQSWRFQQALKGSRPSAGSGEHAERPPPRPAPADAHRVRAESAGTADDALLGRIEISTVGVAAMIMEGTDAKTLRTAVGHIAGTSLPGEPGNVAIAGHRDTFFRELRNIHKDDEITLTTLSGSYRYRVDSTQVVEPEDTEVLDDSADAILTLVTCYPFYFVGPAPKRFIVRAHRIPG